MARDYSRFPDNEDGDILWKMSEEGDNLLLAREIDFSVIFPTEDSALDFAMHLLRHGRKISFSPYEDHEELPWEVQVHAMMVPTHQNISSYERQLAEDAAVLGGRPDGWGCFAQD